VERPAAPSPAHVWNKVSKVWEDPRTLRELRAERWQEVKRQREADEFGSFVWDGSRFDADPVSIQRIQGAAQMALMSIGAGLARTFEWTLYDDSSRTLTAHEMVQVGLALGSHIDDQHRKARQLRRRIEAATTIGELDSITWNDPPETTGTP
jgi:hypothetical protein